MPPVETITISPSPKRRSRVLAAVTAIGVAAVIAMAASASPAVAKAGKSAAAPVRLDVFSPSATEAAGKDGAGFVVDLALSARNDAANALLSPEAGYKPFFNNPSAPTFQPGANGGAPGLVVLLSTTPTTPGTPFQGPNTNLAGLFQINGVGTLKGLARTWNTWQIGRAGFGSGPSVLTAYVVKGTAPAMVPDTGLELISNKVTVPFTITNPASAPQPAVDANATATVKVTKDAKLGDILVDTTGRTVYLFEKDQGTTSACTGACAGTWPAVKTTGTPAVGTGLDAAKIGVVNGQVSYAGHLLYYYAGDSKPGDTNGASIPSWDAVSPAGTPIHAS